jgi:hypothetical protein
MAGSKPPGVSLDAALWWRYTLAHWEALTLILRDGRACIDNSAAERAMRRLPSGVATGSSPDPMPGVNTPRHLHPDRDREAAWL